MNQDFECPRCGHCCKTDLARVGEVGVWGEWVGLTDEEISDLWCEVSNTDFVTIDTHEFAKVIESKLKEKNHG